MIETNETLSHSGLETTKILTELSVEVALWHLCHIVLVQKLARVALLAESSEPVFADDGSVSAEVTEGAKVASRTPTLGEEVTHARHRFWGRERGENEELG